MALCGSEARTRKMYSILLGLIAVLVISSIYIVSREKIEISSDVTTMFPVVTDILSGNLLARGWVFGTNNFFFTDTLPYLIGAFFGISFEHLLTVIPSLFYAGIIVLLLWFIWQSSREAPGLSPFREKTNECYGTGRQKAYCAVAIGCILATLSFLIIPPFGNTYSLLNPNGHICLCFFTILGIVLATSYQSRGGRHRLVIFVLLCTLCQFSDGLCLLVLMFPVICFAGIRFFFGGVSRRRSVALVVASAGAYALSKILAKVIEFAGGGVTLGLPMRFIEAGFLSHAKSFAQVFFIQILGFIPFDAATASQLVIDAVLILHTGLMVFAFLYCLFQITKIDDVCLTLFLVASCDLLGCLFSNVVPVTRYLTIFFIFGTGLTYYVVYLLYRKAFNRKSSRLSVGRKSFVVSLVFCTVCAVWTLSFSFSKASPYVNSTVYGIDCKTVAKMLSEKNWGEGYGAFWDASICSYYTDFTVQIYPVRSIGDNPLQAYPELVKRSWYDETDKHFILTSSGGTNQPVDNERIESILGECDDSIRVGKYTVKYWEKDISYAVTNYNGDAKDVPALAPS